MTTSTPEELANAAAEAVIDLLFPGGFCGDEENSSVGHKGEAEEDVAAILLPHFLALAKDRGSVSRNEIIVAAHVLEIGVSSNDITMIERISNKVLLSRTLSTPKPSSP